MDEQGVNEQELGKPLNASPRMLDTQVNLTEDFLSERCCAFLRFAKFCGNLGLKSSRKTSNCVAYGAKQVVPLSLQNKFCPHKGNLPTAVQRSDVHRCFASRKRCPGIRTTKVKAYENQRTKVFQLRLTSDELLNLKEKAVPYQSVSNYIRKAVEEFTHVDVKQQIEMMQDLCAFYRKFQNELSWAGSNLNQSVRRVNELAVAGLLSPGYVNEVLLPSIQDVQNILKRIKDDLETLNNRTRLIK